MDGSLSFFEIGVADTDKARAFYGQLFGWEFADEQAGATIETPNIPGGLHGDDPGASPYLFFRVSDLSAALDQVRELGGDIGDFTSGEDEEQAARFGRFQTCTDDQGSSFGLHQPPA
jgi:predicted enzyme related to lactoylglutathione lyase